MMMVFLYVCLFLFISVFQLNKKVGSGGTLAPSFHNVVPTLSAQPVNIVQFLGESHTTTVSCCKSIQFVLMKFFVHYSV